MTAPAGPDPRLLSLSAALLVEEAVRGRVRRVDLHRELVDGTARVHAQDLAILFVRRGRHPRLVAASSVAQIDRTGPMAQWAEGLAARLQPPPSSRAVRILAAPDLSLPDADWAEGLPPFWMWLPLSSPKGRLEGVLALLRRTPWQESDRLLAEPLAGCYGHALWARRNRLPDLPVATRLQAAAAVLLLGLATLVPVRLDTLGPAEVAAANPVPIAAPFNGVVADIPVQSYKDVRAGDVLVLFDARELAMERDIASRSLDLAKAELASLQNRAFLDPDSKARIAVAERKVALEQQALAHAQERYERHRLVAPMDGVVLYDDRLGWKGRPVSTGQALMTLAQPDRLELRIDIPSAELIPTSLGAEIRLFLDMDPSRPIQARLTRLGYEARPMPGGGLAYRFVAALDEAAGPLQLGARGTAKVYGESVSLGYYLLRRPWAALRQVLGV